MSAPGTVRAPGLARNDQGARGLLLSFLLSSYFLNPFSLDFAN